MAKKIYRNCFISANGVDLSDHCDQITVDDGVSEENITGFGDAAMVYDIGIDDWTITAEFFDDFESSEVHATLGPLRRGNTTFALLIKPENAASSASNPEWRIPVCRITKYPLINAAVGKAGKKSVTFRNAGSAGLVETQGGTTV